MIIIIFACFWVVCGALAYALTLGYFIKKFPYYENTGVAVSMALAGPVGLVISFLNANCHVSVMRWRPLSREERWLVYHERYPSLSRRQFEEDE